MIYGVIAVVAGVTGFGCGVAFSGSVRDEVQCLRADVARIEAKIMAVLAALKK